MNQRLPGLLTYENMIESFEKTESVKNVRNDVATAEGATMCDIRVMTESDVRQMIANGDDSRDNQIRCTLDGQVFLANGWGRPTDSDQLLFYFETFCAGTNHVGTEAADDDAYIGRIYRTIKANWPKPKYGRYIDIWED